MKEDFPALLNLNKQLSKASFLQSGSKRFNLKKFVYLAVADPDGEVEGERDVFFYHWISSRGFEST